MSCKGPWATEHAPKKRRGTLGGHGRSHVGNFWSKEELTGTGWIWETMGVHERPQVGNFWSAEEL